MSLSRPVAICAAREALCPRCSNPIVGRTVQKADGALVTCMNRHDRGTCGQRIVLLASHGMVVVVGLDHDEFRQLFADDRPLERGLRALGILVERPG